MVDATTGRVRELIHESSPTPISNPDGGVLGMLSVRMLSNGNIIYSSEGDKNNNINAFIREATIDGIDVEYNSTSAMGGLRWTF